MKLFTNLLLATAVISTAAVTSGCYLGVSAYPSSCYDEFINDQYGGYYQRYCYNSGYGGYIPYVSNGQYVYRYNYGYRGPRQVVVAPRTPVRVIPAPGRVVRTPGNQQRYYPQPSPRRGGGYDPAPRWGGGRHDGGGYHGGGGSRPVPVPGRGGHRKGGVETNLAATTAHTQDLESAISALPELPTQVINVTVKASRLRQLNLVGATFANADVSKQIDPTLSDDKVLVQVTARAESQQMLNRFVNDMKEERNLDTSRRHRSVTAGSNRDVCERSVDADGVDTLRGVCVEEVRLISRSERNIELNNNGVRAE